MQIWVGTSGYAYSEWVGKFYPPGTRSGQMLPYYATQFPLVELNFTFYGMPTPTDLENQLKKAPAGFQFVVKLHQSLSHAHDLKQARLFNFAVDPVAKANALSALLCQYPQRFHRSTKNEKLVLDLAERFPGRTYAIEFRHHSWAGTDVLHWLGEHGISVVSVDAPPIEQLYPSGLVQSNRLIYVRWHSRRASSWYEGDKERYDYLYTDSELQEWLDALANHRDDADRVLLLFNNCRRTAAAQNAARITEMIRQSDWGNEVVGPFATAKPREEQGRLF